MFPVTIVAGGGLVDSVISVAVAAGIPVMVALFYAEGVVVGKVAQPPVVFVAYVAAVAPSPPRLLALSALCVLAGTLGQWTLYRGFNEEASEFVGVRRAVPYLDRLPAWTQRRIGDRRLAFVERLFDRYGGIGIAATNAIPGIRCLMTIPAGLSRYPRGRFLLASTVGNVAYVALLVAAATGARRAATLLGVA